MPHENSHIAAHYLTGEQALVRKLAQQAGLDGKDRKAISRRAAALIETIRSDAGSLSPMDALLQEYGLSSHEGVVLMRLAEALIRTPDAFTKNLLLRDRLLDGDWAAHLGSRGATVKTATAGLSLAKGWARTSGGVDAANLAARLGDGVMQAAVGRVISMMANHFVLGSDIASGCNRAEEYEADGFAFSYDMLGEAAHTAEDAERYFEQYLAAANHLAGLRGDYDRARAPSISVKLSALHPRYEYAQKERCVPALTDKLARLCTIASKAGFGLTIDAEEADRLELSLLIFERLLQMEELAGWTGLGIVVQAYQRRAIPVIDAVGAMARRAGSRINLRLVKGAYWDTEIKRAQEMGLESYPVFTRKEHTDVSYLACARRLMALGDIIMPAFATHNAHSAMAVMHMAKDSGIRFEFQRLHGMGEALHAELTRKYGVVSRIYAPVGRHKELLPYLVRRLLENGANSSFVNQLADASTVSEEMARDPIDQSRAADFSPNAAIPEPRDYLGGRPAAKGDDFSQADQHARFSDVVARPIEARASSVVNGRASKSASRPVFAPYDSEQMVGEIAESEVTDVDAAIDAAKKSAWARTPISERAACLRKAADLIEDDADAFMNLCVHEAGKTVPDAIAEIREAVDFCRYYADQAEEAANNSRMLLGVVACISPWNFPLAIFAGQVVAALVMGNGVIAKPAQQTPLIAYRAVKLLHDAGVARDALHLVVGDGALLGSHLTRHADIAGVVFTGSTRTAKIIASSLADTSRALVPLIAETGGINAMIVDSTALLEQVVEDVVASAFQSAGQRCSACRIVCVQDDIAEEFETMLSGAMDELSVGIPNDQSNDLGPVIDAQAQEKIAGYVEKMRSAHRVVGESEAPQSENGYFIAPIAFVVPSVSTVEEEIFGPVLHVVRFAGRDIEALTDEINALGFGLTMGLHTRIDSRVDAVTGQARIGNIYVNRNQIGAVVGVQPFGGEGLSGTGPKAGGPHYLARLSRSSDNEVAVQAVVPQPVALPGPTGEKNTLSLHPRGTILCLGGDQKEDLERQIALAKAAGNETSFCDSAGNDLNSMLIGGKFDAVACDRENRAEIAALIARRDGPIILLLSGHDPIERYMTERTVTIDTTAAGGNAELLAAS